MASTAEISIIIAVSFFAFFIIGTYFCIVKKTQVGSSETESQIADSSTETTDNRELSIEVSSNHDDYENQHEKIDIDLPPSYEELYPS